MMAHDYDTLAEDWVALWQSELAAMAADRELRESWIGLLALWASVSSAALKAPRWRAYDDPLQPAAQPANGTTSTAKPSGAAAVVAASDISGDEARRLYERIAELESRLSTFEQRGYKPARHGSS